MALKFRSACLPFVISTLAASSLWAENLNVSGIAISQRTLDWNEEAGSLKVVGGAMLSYYQLGLVRLSGETTGYAAPGPWSAAWQTSASNPVVTREIDTPAPTSQLTWASPYYSYAKVDMAASTKRVQTRNFSSGWARSAINYSVRVDHSSSTPLDYFVEVDHPKFQLGVSAAYTLQPGGNGGTYLYMFPNAARARAAVDILVDGLPVWSSESTYAFPEGTANYAWDKLLTSWGNTLVDNGTTKLYLGKLYAGKSITITFVLRTDTFVDADACGTAYGTGFNTPDQKRCFDLTQTADLPANSSGPQGISVYAKNLNTTIFPGVPINFPLF
jgi:hypothetical protein